MGVFDRKKKTVTVPPFEVEAPGRANDQTTVAMIEAARTWIIDEVCFRKGHKLPSQGTTLPSPVGELRVTVTGRGKYAVRKA